MYLNQFHSEQVVNSLDSNSSTSGMRFAPWCLLCCLFATETGGSWDHKFFLCCFSFLTKNGDPVVMGNQLNDHLVHWFLMHIQKFSVDLHTVMRRLWELFSYTSWLLLLSLPVELLILLILVLLLSPVPLLLLLLIIRIIIVIYLLTLWYPGVATSHYNLVNKSKCRNLISGVDGCMT